jgi:hypothetical protein
MLTSLTFIWEHTGKIANYNYDRPASGEILRGGGMEGSKRCGFSARWIDLFYRYGARVGCLDRIQGSKSRRLNDARHEVL